MSEKLFFPHPGPRPLITPKELKKRYPLTVPRERFVAEARRRIKEILSGEAPPLLLIIGPCSIHDPASAIEYAQKLQKLSGEIANNFFVVMRVYFEKSRTAIGWPGIMHDPDLDGFNDINKGLKVTRRLLLELIDMGIPTGAEILNPLSVNYMADLLSWCSIGARTASSQIHRHLASALETAVGFKNNTDGNIETAVKSVLTASSSHAFIGHDATGRPRIIRSRGNPDCHIVLRGGLSGPNYDAATIQRALRLLDENGLLPRLVIDCSHDNSRRQYLRQKEVFKEVVDQYLSGRSAIRGLILESNLYPGSQKLDGGNLRYGVSVTDDCLGWQETRELILNARLKPTRKEVTGALTYA